MLRALLLLGGLVLATACLGAVLRAEPEFQPLVKSAAAPKVRTVDPARVIPIVLERPSADEVAANLAPPDKSGTPLQVGFGRAVPALPALAFAATAPGRRAAAIGITSPEAAALRVGVRVASIPSDAVLRFYAPASGPVFEVTGAEIEETFARNAAAGDMSPNARTYWAPAVEGATAIVELELPASAGNDELRISIPSLSHFVTSAARNYAMPKAAAACENDVMCHFTDWGVEANAVARMIFCDGPKCYYCTGTLLADTDTSTSIPYFLTANHCISTQTVASTLQTDWFYRASACNSGTGGASQTLTGGATLLYATTNTDTSFLRLDTTPPGGAAYAGWAVGAPPAVGADMTGIHHPAGDLQKISFGDIASYHTCTAPRGGRFSCSSATLAAATFYGIQWRSGVVEGGSSGSALFDAGQYVVGQLYGGSSSCTNLTATDYYGRFDVAYNAAIGQWLNPPILAAVVSRKSHGGAGTFDVAIDRLATVTGPVSVEPRLPGTAGHSLVFTFSSSISSVGSVTATDPGGLPVGTPSASASGTSVTVALASVPSASRVKVTLANLNGLGFTASAAVGFLAADVDASRIVNSTDVAAVKAQSGLEVDATNYAYDLNLSGAVTAADILVAKGRAGLAL
jgi:hypothetical protein